MRRTDCTPGSLAPAMAASSQLLPAAFLYQSWMRPTKGEIKNEANNGLKNDKYTLAMARTNAPHSATAQFFINTANNDFLNFRSESAQGWGYAVFGRVVDGTAIVDQIEKVRTGSRGFHDDVPVEDVVITRAVIVE